MQSKAARIVPRLKHGQILKMAVNMDGSVDLVLHLKPADHEDRNALHLAMKRARQVGLVFEVGEVECYGPAE
jgi:hypothetical protein